MFLNGKCIDFVVQHMLNDTVKFDWVWIFQNIE